MRCTSVSSAVLSSRARFARRHLVAALAVASTLLLALGLVATHADDRPASKAKSTATAVGTTAVVAQAHGIEKKNGALTLSVRKRKPSGDGSDLGAATIRVESQSWQPKQTAVIICDMWDKHWCDNATARVAEMAPRMNQVVKSLRDRGVFVIHAPSDTLDFYKDTPQRLRAMNAKAAKNQPEGINGACRKLDGEPAFPIDDSDGGCDCETPVKSFKAWSRQIAAIEVAEADAVTSLGGEIWNLLEERGIQNVLLMGVHTNMCVSARPFGLRNLNRAGKNAVLVRDLTDSMYNPAKKPFCSHRRGTELVIGHIETYIAGSVDSRELLGQSTAPHVVFMIGEDEYETWETLPAFAKSELEPRGMKCTFVHADKQDKNLFPGLEVVRGADLLVVSVRRRTPSVAQLNLVRDYLQAGRPVVGIRTSSHAFALRDGKPAEGYATWPEFDAEVWGGDYKGHYGKTDVPQITAFGEATTHPALAGVTPFPFEAKHSLYKNQSLKPGTTPLLVGRHAGLTAPEFVAWTNSYKSGRAFYTSLGAPGDFAVPQFRTLLLNGMYWAMEQPASPSATR